ncbi:MAG: TonB-dependent receptor [Bacteroidales bacterium]|nr:TonB-dependent receptor [Bacteroidales bacterium]
MFVRRICLGYFSLTIIFFLFSISAVSQATLTGKVTDAATGESLPGATLYIPDLKTGVAADKEGVYQFKSLPKSTLLIQVSFMGYGAKSFMINLNNITNMDFRLSEKAIEAQEVVITGSGITTDNNRTSVTITPIGKARLLTTPSTNLIDAISAVPGLSEITTGGNISKPVIRGLSYNHVVTLIDGVRQEGQQWGDEHGIEIDQYSADRIEVLKGPASLFYGSDAMGGVINILEPVHAPMNTIGGEAASQFATNNMMLNSTLMMEGNHNGLIWRGRGSYKNAASYKSSPEYVYNSGFNELNYNALIGLNRKWGFSHIHFSKYDANIGIVEGERDSTTRKFIKMNGEIVTADAAKSRRLELPYHKVRHSKITSVSNFISGDNQVRINLGYQENERREFSGSMDTPALFMHLNTWTGDIKYRYLFKSEIELVTGVGGMIQSNKNKGKEFLVPEYGLNDIGGFVYAKKSWEIWTLNAGLRYDSRWVDGRPLYLDSAGIPALAGDTIFKGFNSKFSAFSGSAGFTFTPSGVFNFKFNLGSGFRSPNIAELGSNGIHEGTFRYEIGNPSLKPESSLQADGEVSVSWDLLNITFAGYYNFIANYIYQRNINGETILKDGTRYQVFRFVQGNSVLKGFELEIDIHPVAQLHFENSIDYVMGTNESSGTPLPFIPALHSVHKLRWNINTRKNSLLYSPYIEIGGQIHFGQNRIDSFETETPGYFLLDASIGAKIQIAQQLWTLYISGNNLTDTRYFDHLSRLKELGVYNPGWGVTIGVVAPFGVYERK